MVTRPATPPYSSITMRMCCFSRCISRNSSLTRLVSGTRAARPLDAGHRLRAGGSIGNMQQIVGEGNAGNVIERAAKHRHARIGMLLQPGDKVFQRHVRGNRKDMRPRGHDFAHHLVAKLNRGADQVAVALFDDSLFLSRFDQGLDRRLAWILLRVAGPGFRQGCDRKQKCQQQGDRQNQVEEHPDERASGAPPKVRACG